ncbi:ATP-binding protein [Bacillus sp. CGMCC 1.16607]|uniref:ATP-binding protein n=1 Tax=Bacillus sp. CGMCC 1.16607 TaxID=3351842 RepID=UPI003634D8B7
MAFKRTFKSGGKNLLIYLFITLLPSLTISYILGLSKVDDIERQYNSKAEWYANFHAMNIENFLSETVGRLEMLATSIKVQDKNLDEIEMILQETQSKDSRFSGFYWSNTKGDLLVSSVPSSSLVNVFDREYFQQAIGTRKTSISEPHIGRVTGRFIITIATPVVDQGQTQGVLLASLRLDEIEEAIHSLIEEEKINVTDQDNKILIETGSSNLGKHPIMTHVPLSLKPWSVTAIVIPEKNDVFLIAFLQYFIIGFILSNILYLLSKYILLQRNVKKEKEQTELQKLELIGNLAASTAHEIRNPLTGIKGLIKLLSEENSDKKSQTYYEVIQMEIDRINSIVSELLVLGKPTANTLMPYHANDILAEIEPLLQSESNFMNVKLTIHFSKDILLISCVKDHLKQVILNLSKNALHAMPNGGNLTITVEKHLEFCVIKVEDTGVGMPKELLSQVFNPFFTMKKDGSGLGLTVCKRIINTYNGDITIDSAPNVGTKVEITLPMLQNSID